MSMRRLTVAPETAIPLFCSIRVIDARDPHSVSAVRNGAMTRSSGDPSRIAKSSFA